MRAGPSGAFREPDQSLLSELRSCRWTFDFWVSERKQDEHKQMLPGNDGAVCALTAAQTETRSFEMHGVGALSPPDAFWTKRRRKWWSAASDAHLWEEHRTTAVTCRGLIRTPADLRGCPANRRSGFGRCVFFLRWPLRTRRSLSEF